MKMYCETCEKVHDIIVKNEERVYKVKDIEVKVNNKISYCSVCGHEVYNRKLELENDIVIFDAYKKEKDMLTSVDIKAIRSKYNITQKALAKLLGFGDKTITRYENGSLQDETHDTMLKLISLEDVFVKLYNLRKHVLTYNEQKRINEALFELGIFPYYETSKLLKSEVYELFKDYYIYEGKQTYKGGDNDDWH